MLLPEEPDQEGANDIVEATSGAVIQMSDYTYELDDASIAIYPASPRGSSKLLRVNENGEVSHFSSFSESFVSLAKGAHVVFNESRVLDARLFVKTNGDQKVEMMILDMGDIDITAPCNETFLTVMLRTDQVQAGDVFDDAIGGIGNIEIAKVNGIWEEDVKSDGNGTECVIRILETMSLEEYLAVAGNVPIPPYFHRDAEISDKESYNNIYAATGGSVAAPTAGLHFTDQVLADLGATNCSFLSLHVGAGTFKPVIVLDARDHTMHAETFSVSVLEMKRIVAVMEVGKPLIAVGTTSSRTLESLYWCGVKRLNGMEIDTMNLSLGQFEWMSLMALKPTVSASRAFQSLLEDLKDHDVVCGKTCLMIVPGSYEFKVVDHLVTNFHAPDSTLMLLVSAFLKSGEKIKLIYEEAQRNGYKFLSYGDVCMLTRPRC